MLIGLAAAIVLAQAEAPRAAAPPPAGPQPSAMAGAWTVDLSTDPKEPYLKAMHLALLPNGDVTGDFYDSTIEAGRWKAQNGRLCVAFRTTDGAGPYHTAACLAGAGIEGQTWAEHRQFVFVWSAKQQGAAETRP